MSDASTLRRAAGLVGHGLREVATLPRALARRDGPRLAICPSGSMHPRNDLRAYALGHALRRRGWSVMIVPKQLGRSQRRRLFRIFGPDLLLFQTCRHALNDAEHAMGHPWVLDLDDADFFDEGLRNRMEQTAAGAAGVVAGSRFIRDWARGMNPRVRVIWTGTPQTAAVPPGHASRPRIVA